MNWVERRYECNARHTFSQLCNEARISVETRLRQLQADSSGPGLIPKLEKPEENIFTVTRDGEMVTFAMVDLRTIRVSGDHISAFGVHVGLDDEQQCVLTVVGQCKEPWQVLYMALDKLLF